MGGGWRVIYYLIFILNGKVVDISSYEDEESREIYLKYIEQYNLKDVNGREFDEVQMLDIVK